MRITLVHNPTSGDADHSGEDLAELARAAGHEVSYHSSKSDGLEHVLAKPTDLLLVAGGDGTVRKVVRKLARQDVLMGILPLGSSNNIASALGLDIEATAEEHIAGLEAARRVKMDVGVARAPWGTELFLESAGVGSFAELLREAQEKNVTRPAARLRKLMEEAQLRQRRVVADEKDLSGKYVIAAVLNTPRIGSAFELAPAGEVGDGWLDLVLVGEQEREALGEYLRSLESGESARMQLPTHRVQRVRLEWSEDEGHLDDELWPEESDSGAREARAAIDVEIELAGPVLHVAVTGASARSSPR